MKTIRAVLTAVAVATMIAAPACKRDADEEAAAKPASAEGSTEVALPADGIAANGIEIAELRHAPDTATASTIAYATVVDSTPLLEASSQAAAAHAQRDQSRARADASRAQLARTEGLHADDRNASDRAVEEARAAAAVDEASLRAAESAASAADTALRQAWGPALADGLSSGAAWSASLPSGRSVLVEVAFPADAVPPGTIELAWEKRLVPARLLGASPRVDAHLQRPSNFYLCDEPAIPSGLTLPVVSRPAGARGVLVPEDAVVWYGGHAWVFVETAAGRFRRTAIGAADHVTGGFVEATLKPGTRVVVRGAGQLLSEQNKPAVEE